MSIMQKESPGHRHAIAAVGIAWVLAGTLTTRASAEIERIAEPGATSMVFLWWPKVTPPAGWVHLREVSIENHINMFVPKGASFESSPVIMYARAIYFEKGDTARELGQAIRDDHDGFGTRFPDSKIEEVAGVATGDGTKLRTFSFTPAGEGSWELVAYGREPKHVLMFCVSARSAKDLEAHRADFLAMVRSYVSADSEDDPARPAK